MPAQVPIEARKVANGVGAVPVGGWSVCTVKLPKWASTFEPPGKSMIISMLLVSRGGMCRLFCRPDLRAAERCAEQRRENTHVEDARQQGDQPDDDQGDACGDTRNEQAEGYQDEAGRYTNNAARAGGEEA